MIKAAVALGAAGPALGLAVTLGYLRSPYVAITAKSNKEFITAASYGANGIDLMHVPLIYQAEQVGELLLAPRVPGEAFTAADKRLLNDLAHEVGVAVHAVRLTSDLQRLMIDSQRSCSPAK